MFFTFGGNPAWVLPKSKKEVAALQQGGSRLTLPSFPKTVKHSPLGSATASPLSLPLPAACFRPHSSTATNRLPPAASSRPCRSRFR